MHILFFTDNFPPEVNAPASRTYEHAREWALAGHKVTVITCAPNFPKGEVFAGYRNKLWQREQMDGIHVVRVWTYVTKNEGFFRRILDYQSYMVSSFLASLFIRRVDVVIGTSPQFFAACAAWASAAVKRRPFVFELRDIWPESIRAVGAMKNSAVLDFFEKVELFLYARAQKVVAVTHSFRHNLVGRGIAPEKVQVITNGVDMSRYSRIPRDLRLENALGLKDRFVVGYIGTHGMAHALETLLDAASEIQADPRTSDVTFLFLGDGANRDRLITRAAELGLENVIFLESVPKVDVHRYWSLLDASIIHLRKTDLFKSVIPSKLFECMAMGIPILHGVEGESADIVVERSIGMIFEPENSAELVERVLELKTNAELRASLSANGQAAAPDFNRATLAADMLNLLEELA
ncbi:Putative teichuronic acid biosynthesis glycosyltransferase TuaH (plasmid) [Sulfitobacter indolifex]|uniref:glycosyltransferase family 4 protein n=1 Tax=Sulfitobacter indolifex TaxID=225422 RepID=UPI001FAE57B5|nr:glycosyltransferase family 4 protein [Sulfitobacter indolifex]UOA20684.1 Putative teichuronic acid biosynthesis glycosyltransferase TuaH [Sulfitobacter indolifex]